MTIIPQDHAIRGHAYYNPVDYSDSLISTSVVPRTTTLLLFPQNNLSSHLPQGTLIVNDKGTTGTETCSRGVRNSESPYTYRSLDLTLAQGVHGSKLPFKSNASVYPTCRRRHPEFSGLDINGEGAYTIYRHI